MSLTMIVREMGAGGVCESKDLSSYDRTTPYNNIAPFYNICGICTHATDATNYVVTTTNALT